MTVNINYCYGDSSEETLLEKLDMMLDKQHKNDTILKRILQKRTITNEPAVLDTVPADKRNDNRLCPRRRCFWKSQHLQLSFYYR
jgi:hypothetical protein